MKEKFNKFKFMDFYKQDEKLAIDYIENKIDKRTLSQKSWREIAQYKKGLSRSFIKKYIDKFKIIDLCINQNLSETLMKENLHQLDEQIWSLISEFQILSESFIEEFQKNLDWYRISRYQKLSLDFLVKFKNEIIYDNIRYNKKISKEIKKKFFDYLKLIK